MKSAPLLTVALGMIACTHLGTADIACVKDSTPATNLIKNTQTAPVVNSKKAVTPAAPELPFFKDVLDTKRLFW